MKLSGIEGVDPDIERKLRQAMNVAQLAGWKLTRHCTQSSAFKMCCALGAVGVARGVMSHRFDTLSQLLGLDFEKAAQLTLGFDGQHGRKDEPYYHLGRLLGNEYVKEDK